VNARADFEQQLDDDERQAKTLQALMNLSAAGLRNEADFFAAECGLWRVWKEQFQPKGNRNAAHK
jgi:hypothetical protein